MICQKQHVANKVTKVSEQRMGWEGQHDTTKNKINGKRTLGEEEPRGDKVEGTRIKQREMTRKPKSDGGPSANK